MMEQVIGYWGNRTKEPETEHIVGIRRTYTVRNDPDMVWWTAFCSCGWTYGQIDDMRAQVYAMTHLRRVTADGTH